jgi:hypothetical protein
MIFDKKYGTPKKGGEGCHPLYAAIDHIAPQRSDLGFQLVCYDLNDLKGHLSPELFDALKQTEEWKRLIIEWRRVADSKAPEVRAFKALIFGQTQANKLDISALVL